jgi:transcriptional regulator with XRE-family HTH domain
MRLGKYLGITGKISPNNLAIRGINFAGMDTILAKIRAVRKNKGLSQEEIADKIGIDQKTYGNWETGRTDLTLRMIERIAKAMDVDVKVFWDPRQFEDPNWKPDNSYQFSDPGSQANDGDQEYTPSLVKELLDTKNKLITQQAELIKIQKEEIERLKAKT